MTLTYPGWNGCVSYEAAPAFKTLTLYHSEGGTLTANTLTGYPGDTINLTTAYNTYWRFSGYQWTGDGSLVGNDYTFGNEDATICACYKVNAFTATGTFEKGSDVTVNQKGGTYYKNVPAGYAITVYRTSGVPTAWYATSNRWHPNGASAYKITINNKLSFTAYTRNGGDNAQFYTACSLLGSTETQKQTAVRNVYNTSWNYNVSFTSNVQNINYGYSARIGGVMYRNGGTYVKYVAANTTGTWTATGYAP